MELKIRENAYESLGSTVAIVPNRPEEAEIGGDSLHDYVHGKRPWTEDQDIFFLVR